MTPEFWDHLADRIAEHLAVRRVLAMILDSPDADETIGRLCQLAGECVDHEVCTDGCVAINAIYQAWIGDTN